MAMARFSHGRRERHSIASQLEGALLISKDTFPYFMLVAFEAGGPLRALLLLLAFPLLWLLEFSGLLDVALRVMIFVSTAGLRAAEVKAVAKATFPKFLLEDLRESAFRVFSTCGGGRYVVSCMPRVMVEPFLREYLDVEHVIGTELRMVGRWCTGLVASPGVMAGVQALEAVRVAMGDSQEIDVGLGDGLSDHPFLLLCREPHLLLPSEATTAPLPRADYPKPLIFHDGRFATLPTPLTSLAILLWLPFALPLAALRVLLGLLPYRLGPLACAATGFLIRARLPAPPPTPDSLSPTLFACSHRTLLDPVLVSTALQRRVTAVTYSLSRLSELISPIPTARLRRDRSQDGVSMLHLLSSGDLVVCPEGTTCREPYLLRFSPLFAEVAAEGNIVPVAAEAGGSLFYGTTARGYKGLDSLFFLMNPRPWYRLEFLERVAGVREGRSGYEVANGVQREIGRVLGFECTNLTRKDKYRMLAGNDGVDPRF